MRDLVVEDFLHGYGDNHAVFFAKEARDFREGVAGKIEAYEETLLAFRAAHGGLEGVDVGAVGFVLLLHLDVS